MSAIRVVRGSCASGSLRTRSEENSQERPLARTLKPCWVEAWTLPSSENHKYRGCGAHGESWLKGREATFRNITHPTSDLQNHISKLCFLIVLDVSWPLITAGTTLFLSELLNACISARGLQKYSWYLGEGEGKHAVLGCRCSFWMQFYLDLIEMHWPYIFIVDFARTRTFTCFVFNLSWF